MKRTVRLLAGAAGLFSLFALLPGNAFGQRTCSTMEHYAMEVANDPERAARMEQLEHFTEQWTAAHGSEDRAVVTIPVVVHLVYKTTAQNISDARIIAQIAQLNADYAHMNSDAGNVPSVFTGLAANTNIQFCLASVDPTGAATTGIERKLTTVTSWSDNDAVKYTSSGGLNAWPAASYLNLWVCNLGSGLLGYAQFPGGAAATDGVVVLYSTVGSMTTPGTMSPYQYGRSATHEVGHWLNLRHIWGDANCGNDLVSDTPTQQTSNFSCPSFPHVTCSNGPNGDMFMNYMDYVDDGCMDMFSAGQAARMNALFASGGARYAMLSSTGCSSGSTACNAPGTPSAGSITTTGATISWTAVSGATSYNLRYKLSTASTWTTVSTTATSYALSSLASGTAYNAQVQTVCTSGSSAFSSAITFTTSTTPATCDTPTGLAASSITTSGATIGWTAVGGASSYNLQYKLGSASTWTTVNTTATSYTLSGLASSTAYNAQVQTVCASGSSAYSSAIGFTTATPAGCSDVYESNNTSGTAVTIPVNTDITALIGASGDNDWYKFTNTSSTSKIKVTLTNLPGDYDLKLYRGTSTLLGTSQNGGTTSEQLISNTTTVTTYYIKVYGYNGANSATSCYTLRASLSSTNWREMENTAVEEVTNSLLNLYPNPASDKLNVDFLAEGDTQLQVEVMDLTGRVVMTTTQAVTAGPSTFGLQLPDLRNGMYLLRITDGKQQMQQRFMLQR